MVGHQDRADLLARNHFRDQSGSAGGVVPLHRRMVQPPTHPSRTRRARPTSTRLPGRPASSIKPHRLPSNLRVPIPDSRVSEKSGEAQGEVLRNVAPETTKDELDAAYVATARDNPLYPYEPEVEQLATRQRRRRWPVK